MCFIQSRILATIPLIVNISRELLLCNNLLRSLPYEIGKLFHLQILGLQGNPLNKECWKIYNEPNGTPKLLSFLLDSLAGKISLFNIMILYLVNSPTIARKSYQGVDSIVYDRYIKIDES